jgi:hypothetical protein
MNSAEMLAGSLVANDSLLLANDSHFTTPEQCSTNTSCTSPVSPTGSSRVGFSSTQPAENTYDKDRVRFLTAKYPKHQMGLIRKRLAVEDWIDEALKKLFDVSDDDNETYDTLIDLDELLNYDSDSERASYIQQKVAHAPKSEEVLKKFVEDLLAKANTL